jgi:hypothetical protein
VWWHLLFNGRRRLKKERKVILKSSDGSAGLKYKPRADLSSASICQLNFLEEQILLKKAKSPHIKGYIVSPTLNSPIWIKRLTRSWIHGFSFFKQFKFFLGLRIKF